jgi:hypothetical protein
MKYVKKDDNRYSQLWIRSYPRDWTKLDEDANYQKAYIGADLDSESSNAFDDSRVKVINSRWFSTDTQSATLWTRFKQLYSEPPIEITAKLDASDSDLSVGDYVDVTTREILNPDGTEATFRAFITELKETNIGDEFQITAMSTGFTLGLRYGFVCQPTQGDYGTATDEEKAAYCWIAPGSTSTFADGSDAYRII